MALRFHRRHLLASAATVAVASSAAPSRAATPADAKSRVRYCLNTSTIRGQNLPIDKEIALAAKAGYSGVEPWIRELTAFEKKGGSLNDLKKQLSDSGLKVESAIGFANWIVDDDKRRKQALEDAKRDMDLVRRIGGTRIAAPPAGATREAGLDLFRAAERYRALLKLGAKMGVTPQVELWGFSRNLARLGELLLVAIESGHADACLLPDVYHIYKGGSDFAGLELINGRSMHVFHMNDYPANPPRAEIKDEHRVFPGDGVAPLSRILSTILQNGFQGALSLELFNRDYWKRDAGQVVAEGLRKMKAAVERATA